MASSARFDNLPKVQAVTITVTVSGTPVQGSDVNVPKGVNVVVKAHPANTGRITMASTSATANKNVTTNFPLNASESVEVLVRNFNNLWFDSTVSGDRVVLLCEQA